MQKDKTPKIKKNRFMSSRSMVIFLLCIVVFAAIFIRLYGLEVVDYDVYHEKVVKNKTASATESAVRGDIYDSNGMKLATSYRVYRIFISPKDALNFTEEDEDGNEYTTDKSALVASIVSEYIEDVSYSDVMDIIKNYPEKLDRTIQKNVDEDTTNLLMAAVEEAELDTVIYSELSYKRYYTYGSLASHVIGFCGTDGGLAGLEMQYDDYLSGTSGKYVFTHDAIGQSIISSTDTTISAKDGYNLNTTIDIRLQTILENQLKQTYIDSKPGEGGRVAGICVDVNTMAILAMGTYPSFDCNSPYTLDEYSQAELDLLGLSESSEEYLEAQNEAIYKMWRNLLVSDTYEPGSTFKIVSTAAAIEEKAITWDTEVTCNGWLNIDGQTIRCHKTWGHGEQTFARGLQMSCNPTLMTAVLNLGKDKFYEYFEAFGFTAKTGIDLPGEATSIYYDISSCTDYILAQSAFGQAFKVTPIQEITAVATVANGGYLRTPYVVSTITDDDGNVVYTHDTTYLRQVVSTQVCEEIADVLQEGTSTDGAARNAYVAGYKIAAKTGTSQVLDILNEDGEVYLNIGSCVAYAPADDPQIAVLILVQYPQGDSVYGNYVAAPYVANFLEEALPYIGVERNLTEEEEAKLNVTLRNYLALPVTDVTSDLSGRKISYVLYGDGDLITYQIPAGGSTLNRSTGKVILYCGDAEPEKTVIVPDVVGYTSTNAQNTIVGLGLNIKFSGVSTSASKGALVISQSPEAGTEVDYGTVVSVTIRHVGDTD